MLAEEAVTKPAWVILFADDCARERDGGEKRGRARKTESRDK